MPVSNWHQLFVSFQVIGWLVSNPDQVKHLFVICNGLAFNSSMKFRFNVEYLVISLPNSFRTISGRLGHVVQILDSGGSIFYASSCVINIHASRRGSIRWVKSYKISFSLILFGSLNSSMYPVSVK